MRISDWSSDVCSSDLIILSSLVSHHMTPAQRSEFLRFMESEAARGWLVNDLHRQRLPFAGYPLLASLALVDPIVRRDGQLSVGRSFRRAEWAAKIGRESCRESVCQYV